MRRNDECGLAVEANQTERAKAVNAGGGVRYVFALGGKRMEVRSTKRLNQQQNRNSKTCGAPLLPLPVVGF
jgi:hypothetical protein